MDCYLKLKYNKNNSFDKLDDNIKELINNEIQKMSTSFNHSSSERIPNRNNLINLIKTYNFKELGRMFGVSDNSVRKWCKKYKLPFRSSDIKKMTEDDWNKITNERAESNV